VVTDLSVLRELAEGLLRYDAVTFLQLLDTLRLSEGRAAVWLLHSAAHTIFDYVRDPLAWGAAFL
jgi:DNA excision repair protein ERCC-4